MNRPCCSACKSPLDPNAESGGRCPICGSPVIARTQPAGPEEWDAVARRDPAFARRWALGEPIGAGRASLVYRATAKDTGDACAVKLLIGVSDPAVVHVFHSGEGCGPAIEHAGVVSPLACGVLENAKGQEIGYLVRPFIDGHALSLDLTAGPLPLARSLSIFASVLAALQAVHRAGLVHGDPKPSDVILTEDGQVRLVDAACPREPLPVGAPGRPLPAGAPEYLSPEVAAGAPPTPASDLYAAAVMLVEMITGTNPFRQPTPQASLSAHAHNPPVPPELAEAAPEVAALIARACAADPFARPEITEALRTAQELARASALRGTLLKLPLPRPVQALAAPAARFPVRAASAVALVIALAGGLAYALRSRPGAGPAVESPPAVRLMVGTHAVLVRLADPGAEPIRVRCWPEGTPEAAAPLQPSVSPPASGPLTVRIGDLKPGTAYRVRVLRGPGAGDEPELRLRTRTAPSELVREHRVVYRPGGGVRVFLSLADRELPVEIWGSGSPSVTTTGGPASSTGVTLPIPALGTTELKVRFPGLGDELTLGSVVGAHERMRAVAAGLAKLGETALFSEPDAPAALLERALATSPALPPARASVDGWMAHHLGITAAELAELARAVYADDAVPLPERWLLYQSIEQLRELEPLARARGLATPLFPELALAQTGQVQLEVKRADAPTPTGLQPLADLTRLARAPLPLWSSIPRGDARPAAALFTELAEPDTTVVPVPVNAMPPGDGDHLELAIRVAGLDPRTRLVADAGDGAQLGLRSTTSPAMPTLSADTVPERAALEPTSEWLIARFPAPATPALVRLSTARDPNAGSSASPIWVLDLILRRVK